jgi:phytoene dehydrogenase-like protein
VTSNTPSIRELCQKTDYDAVIIGSGPNGVAAGIVLAQKGMSVVILEAQPTAGGGCRSAALTLPGYVHDVCSSIHPLGFGSPFFRTLPLAKHGLKWIHPLAPFAQPFDGGRAVVVERDVIDTAHSLGPDGPPYIRLMSDLRPNWNAVADALLNPSKLLFHPFAMSRFGLRALKSAEEFANSTFRTPMGKGLVAGIAAHSGLPLSTPTSAAIALVLGVSAHAVGWPMPEGGSQKLMYALFSFFRELGGEVVCSAKVDSLDQLPNSKLVLCDITPQQLLSIADNKLPDQYKRALKKYKYGPATFKMDFALDGPIPWQAREISRAGTVHIGNTIEEISASEAAIARGETTDKPYVLLAQHTLFDPSRAPQGKHTVWAYCHVPNGSSVDMSAAIENQIERFAPGFKNLILARSIMTPKQLQDHNGNYIGGDINGGALIPSQLFMRPTTRPIPWATPVKGLYFCSSSTPPGSGVHGMCGYYAAQLALRGWQ